MYMYVNVYVCVYYSDFCQSEYEMLHQIPTEGNTASSSYVIPRFLIKVLQSVVPSNNPKQKATIVIVWLANPCVFLDIDLELAARCVCGKHHTVPLCSRDPAICETGPKRLLPLDNNPMFFSFFRRNSETSSLSNCLTSGETLWKADYRISF